MKYIFGPINSRRLGVSLGIDLLPFKTCSLDCIYCECGSTNKLTVERKEYVPTDDVLREIDEYLADSPALDYITFSGSGEPCMRHDSRTLRVSFSFKSHWRFNGKGSISACTRKTSSPVYPH